MLRLPIVLALCAGVAGSIALSGCGEEPPPPPPPKKAPPPPPPPPPPEISIQALLQEAKADARVAFADSVKITDEALARAVITLADGFARGDATKLKTVLDDGAVIVLNTLDASGEWAESTAGIEAVRVVYVGDAGDAFTSSGEGGADSLSKIAAGPLADAITSLPADKLAKVTSVLASIAANPTPEAIADLEKKLQEAGLDAADALKFKSMFQAAVDQATIDGLASGSAGGSSDAPQFSRVVVLSVQDANGAFLLGFGIEDQSGAVRFGNAPTVSVTKRRASDFDSIGLGAFAIGRKAVAGATPAPGEEGRPGEVPAPTPGAGTPSPDNPGGPTRKSTPGGPITVPGSG
jgi:hypothetical protein